MTTIKNIGRLRIAALALLCGIASAAFSAPAEPVLSLAQKEQAPLLETLKQLVEIESGSRDLEGLDRIANVVAGKLKALGASVEMIEPDPKDVVRRFDTPEKLGRMVRGTLTGTGTRKILLIAHMDTVYPRGMLAKQPFRIEGDRAWGLGIADDRHGIAVILHTLSMLRALNVRDYGTITVLINGDEEIGSPASRNTLTRLGGEHDVTLSFEGGSRGRGEQVRLATAGTATAVLHVRGRGAHAGVNPEGGVNALYELAHQVLQARDLSDKANNIKVNWTMGRAGIVRNMIPPGAEAEADIRVERVADLDGVEQRLRERIKTKLLPESVVTLDFHRGRPPLQATDASRALAEHAKGIYSEIGRDLFIGHVPTGGGTDAAYAALKTKAPVLEGLGLAGYGAHSTDAEYVRIDSIVPRLYLATRMIIDIAQGKAPLPAR